MLSNWWVEEEVWFGGQESEPRGGAGQPHIPPDCGGAPLPPLQEHPPQGYQGTLVYFVGIPLLLSSATPPERWVGVRMGKGCDAKERGGGGGKHHREIKERYPRIFYKRTLERYPSF